MPILQAGYPHGRRWKPGPAGSTPSHSQHQRPAGTRIATEATRTALAATSAPDGPSSSSPASRGLSGCPASPPPTGCKRVRRSQVCGPVRGMGEVPFRPGRDPPAAFRWRVDADTLSAVSRAGGDDRRPLGALLLVGRSVPSRSAAAHWSAASFSRSCSISARYWLQRSHRRLRFCSDRVAHRTLPGP